MKNKQNPTIKITPQFKKKLDELKLCGRETYEEVIKRNFQLKILKEVK